ncbi:MAG: hypothetical protein AB7S38_30565 [Vulcanimicrobiota bacterium]
MESSRAERLQEFFRRLAALSAAGNAEEALLQIEQTLNQVEDEFTGIVYDPENWQTDGRMYPPQKDSLRNVDGFDGVQRFRSRQHNTFLGPNGAIETRRVATPPESGEILFRKNGADGKGVWPE